MCSSDLLTGNKFEKVTPINFWNLDKTLDQVAPGELRWGGLTTGGFAGFDAWLADPAAGTLKIDTPLVKTEIKVGDIGLDDYVFANGGIKRQLRVFRMPDENTHTRAQLTRRVKLTDAHDNALYVCVTQEDGHLIWSSPVYIFNSP